jgi:hypothetical protein
MRGYDTEPDLSDIQAEYAGIGEGYDSDPLEGDLHDGVTADTTDDSSDISDDLPDSYGDLPDDPEYEDALDPDVQIKRIFGDENPWEGLEKWAEAFDPKALPCYLSDDRLAHFHLGIDITEPAAADDWAQALRAGYDATGMTFEGDMARAGACMAAFENGVRFVHDTFGELGVAEEVPIIRIVSDIQVKDSEAGMAATAGEVFINGLMLEDSSMCPADELVTSPHPDTGQPPGMIGTMEQLYFLGGVEEAHHSIHERHMPPCEPSNRSLPHIEYHTNEREYQALRWKLMAAKRTGMSQEMVGALEHTYHAATALRRQGNKAP